MTALVVVMDAANAGEWKAGLLALQEMAPPPGTMVELRLDLLSALPDPDLLQLSRYPVIVTCRRRADGGHWGGEEKARIDLLRRGLWAGAVFVDLEEDVLPSADWAPKEKVLGSIHDFHGTPGGLDERVERILRRAELCKVAVRATGLADLLLLQRLVQAKGGRVVAVGMGPVGQPSRLLPTKMGSPWVYCRWSPEGSEGRMAAPGLLGIEEMTKLYYPSARLDPPVGVFGVLSDRLGISIGPRFFNRLFREHSVRALYMPVATPNLVGLREFLRNFGVRGMSITTPYKEAVIEVVDEADPISRAIQAANTLLVKDGRVSAFNTDYAGVHDPVASVITGDSGPLGDAVVFGVGGAGKAAALALKGLGFEVTLTSRDAERGQKAAALLSVPWKEKVTKPPRLIVNATPLGGARAPDGSPVVESLLAADQVVLEMNYGRSTPLLRAALAGGARVIPGEEMYLAQARRQLELFWSGLSLEMGDLRKALQWAQGES